MTKLHLYIEGKMGYLYIQDIYFKGEVSFIDWTHDIDEAMDFTNEWNQAYLQVILKYNGKLNMCSYTPELEKTRTRKFM